MSDEFALVRVRFFEGPTQIFDARLVEAPRAGDLVMFPSGRRGSVKAVVWDLTDEREDNARLDMAMEALALGAVSVPPVPEDESGQHKDLSQTVTKSENAHITQVDDQSKGDHDV